MEIVWGGSSSPEINSAIAAFVASKIPGCTRGFGVCSTMGVIEGASLIGGIVYHNYAPEAGVIELSGAADAKTWLTRPVLKAMFSYPFDQIGCQLVVMRVSETNETWNGRGINRILAAYGFKNYRVPRLRGRNEAEIIHTLSDDDWRANGFHKDMING